MDDNAEGGSAFVSEVVTMLATNDILDKIKSDVRLTPDNLRNLIELMTQVGAATVQTTDPDDPELRTMDAAHQLKHALGDMLREVGETGA